MPIEVQVDDGNELEAVDDGQQVYEALLTILEVASETQVMGLLAAIKRKEEWQRLSPVQREICAALELELFDEEGT